ncbi:MAG: hypothetical protein ACXABY_00710 [Candidatus Thorarchaeota archaeon]|jgi:hypothetical protein
MSESIDVTDEWVAKSDLLARIPRIESPAYVFNLGKEDEFRVIVRPHHCGHMNPAEGMAYQMGHNRGYLLAKVKYEADLPVVKYWLHTIINYPQKNGSDFFTLFYAKKVFWKEGKPLGWEVR